MATAAVVEGSTTKKVGAQAPQWFAGQPVPITNNCKRGVGGAHKLGPIKRGASGWPVRGYPLCDRRPIIRQCLLCGTDLTVQWEYNAVFPKCPLPQDGGPNPPSCG